MSRLRVYVRYKEPGGELELELELLEWKDAGRHLAAGVYMYLYVWLQAPFTYEGPRCLSCVRPSSLRKKASTIQIGPISQKPLQFLKTEPKCHWLHDALTSNGTGAQTVRLRHLWFSESDTPVDKAEGCREWRCPQITAAVQDCPCSQS